MKKEDKDTSNLPPPQVSRETLEHDVLDCRTPRQFKTLLKGLRSLIPYQNMACGWCCIDTYKIIDVISIGYPEQFLRWYVSMEMLKKDPCFHEWLKEGRCQILSDVASRSRNKLDKGCLARIKEFKLENSLVGGVVGIHEKRIGYFTLTMSSYEECISYLKAFENLLPVLYEGLKNRYQDDPSTYHSTCHSNYHTQLTDKEKDLLWWRSLGYSRDEIGLRLNISERMVKEHLCRIRNKLKAKNEIHAISIAIRRKLIG